MFPDDLRYTREHEWVDVVAEGRARFGITDHAQDALGDIVFVTLPALGASLAAGEPCGEVESTKSVSDVYSPASGVITSVNELLNTNPETINADPYGDGWLFELELADFTELDDLMEADEYAQQIGG